MDALRDAADVRRLAPRAISFAATSENESSMLRIHQFKLLALIFRQHAVIAIRADRVLGAAAVISIGLVDARTGP